MAAAAMWELLLDRIPTQIGKLVSVASFRVGTSGDYRQRDLDRVVTPEITRRVLAESHEHLFAEWVGLFPDEQAADMNCYLAALPSANAKNLLRKASESLIPPTASAAARRAFLADLEALFLLDEDDHSPAPLTFEHAEALSSVA